MDRRTFVGSIGLALVTAPLAAEAQPAGKVSRIGVLGTSPPAAAVNFQAFRKGLQEFGYVEGRRSASITDGRQASARATRHSPPNWSMAGSM